MSFKKLSAVLFFSGILFSLHAAVAISGTVKDQSGTAIQGAVVILARASLSTESDATGLYALGGTVSVAAALDRTLTAGDYRIPLLPFSSASQMRIVRERIGSSVTACSVPLMRGGNGRFGGPASEPMRKAAPTKALASVDSLVAWAVGYR
jgi:hypothetical protein